MGLSQKLAMRQGQSLVMTPQLSQSIKLLAMSNIELSAFVEQELEKNPLLEEASAGAEEAPIIIESALPVMPAADSAIDLTEAQTQLASDTATLSASLQADLDDGFADNSETPPDLASHRPGSDTQGDNYVAHGGMQITHSASAHDQTVADFTADKPTLRDHLSGQLAISGADAPTAFIVRALIENLDEAGYLRVPLTELGARLATDECHMEKALKLLQSFEPVGIGARDLAECLRLQLADLNRLDPAMAQVIDNIDLLARRDFDALRKLSGLDVGDLHDILVEIQALDPKPGLAFDNGTVQHIVPDIFVVQANDGSWKIELNNDTLPRVLVNNRYAASLKKKVSGEAEQSFVNDCLQNANWLTKSLDQRAQTILKVVCEIVKQQDGFLVHGVSHLRPLTLRAVADEIEMHESSVSRVTNNKYVMTSRGLFELKYFFTTSIASVDDGEGHSSEAVRARIKTLIEAETGSTILSDDAIVDLLKGSGIDIARRTIAKYREAMGVPSSVQRRREKRAFEAAHKAVKVTKSVALAH